MSKKLLNTILAITIFTTISGSIIAREVTPRVTLANSQNQTSQIG